MRVKRNIILFSIVLLLMCLFTINSFATYVTDLDGKWYEQDSKFAVERGWINGYPDNTFRGDNLITRAEFVTILNRIIKEENEYDSNYEYMNKFVDVNTSDWYYNDVLKAVSLGWINGYNDINFGPNDLIARQDAFTIIGRLEYFKAIESNGYISIDINSIPSYAQNAIIKLYNLRIIQGDQNGNLNAQNSITRAEAITLLKRVYNVINNIPEPFIDPIFEVEYDKTSSSPSIYLMNPHDMYKCMFDFSFESPKELNEFSYIPPDLYQKELNREYINYLTEPYHVNLSYLYPLSSEKLMFVVPKWKLNNYKGYEPYVNEEIKVKVVVYKDEKDKHIYYIDVINKVLY